MKREETQQFEEYLRSKEPDSPHSPTQRYRLTAKGKGARVEKTR